MLIKNVRLIDPKTNTDKVMDVCIEQGKIASQSHDDIIIDGTNLIMAPGLVDVHVHFRDPGQTAKEDLVTGTNAAILGGYSDVVCMANTVPIMDNVELYLETKKRMEQLPIHVHQACAISKGFHGKKLTPMDQLKSLGVLMFSDDGLPLKDEAFVLQAMKKAKDLNTVLSFHEEDPSYIGFAGINDGKISEQLGFKGANRMAEIAMVERDLKLAKMTGACINIQHISSKEAVELVREAKLANINVHAEACPHHFTLTENDVLTYGSLAKMNPPLRLESDRQAIIEGLKDGTIDLIATDHAPHTSEEKARELTKTPSGIIGLETALALANQELVLKNHLSYLQLFACMATNPAKLIGKDKSLEIGQPADFILFDPNKEWKVETFASKATNSPFTNWTLKGKVVANYINGKKVGPTH